MANPSFWEGLRSHIERREARGLYPKKADGPASSTFIPDRSGCLLLPLGDEHVRLPLGLRIAIRREHEMLPVRREHREAIERAVVGDALETGAVDVDQVEIEVPTPRIVHVRGEDDPLAIGVP